MRTVETSAAKHAKFKPFRVTGAELRGLSSQNEGNRGCSCTVPTPLNVALSLLLPMDTPVSGNVR